MKLKNLFVLLFLIFFSCQSETSDNNTTELTDTNSIDSNTVQEENVLAEESKIPENLVGTWINEGELSSLTINADGTCELSLTDVEENTEKQITGELQLGNGAFSITWVEPVFEKELTTYFYEKKENQEVLFEIYTPEEAMTYGATEGFAFAKAE